MDLERPIRCSPNPCEVCGETTESYRIMNKRLREICPQCYHAEMHPAEWQLDEEGDGDGDGGTSNPQL